MLDVKGTLIVIGLIVLAAVVVMILVRPGVSGHRYRRVGLGQTGEPGSRPAAEPAPPSAQPAPAPEERKAERA